MSTWQLFSDAGKDFRWEASGKFTRSKLDGNPNGAPCPPLPSMADLLVEGLPKVLENGGEKDGEAPMFRTGLGKSVVLKESSIAKAMSALGDDLVDRGFNRDEVLPRNNGFGTPNSLFQTGSGKNVNISSAGLLRAKSLFGLEEDNDLSSFQGGFQQPRKFCEANKPFGRQSLTDMEGNEGIQNNGGMGSMSVPLVEGLPEVIENDGERDGEAPMFRTGSGKSMVLKESSIAKAVSVLGDGTEDRGFKPDGVLPGDNRFGTPNSLFQTGLGKNVNISSAGLLRAKRLLGLEEDNDLSSFQGGFQQPRKFSEANKPFGQQSLTDMEGNEGVQNNGSLGPMSVPNTVNFRTSFSGSKSCSENELTPMQSKMCNSASKPPPIKFHTAGGMSISVSSDALKRARSLLGDPELETFFDEVGADDKSSSSLKQQRGHDSSGNKENGYASFTSYQGATKGKHTPAGFISPLNPYSMQVRSLVNSENITSGSNLIKKFDAVGNANVCGLTDSIENPLGSKPSVSTSNSLGRSSRGPLMDISNRIPSDFTNNKQSVGEKRRFARINTVSPFKRPRNSKFSTPLKPNPLVSNGLSPLPPSQPCPKRTVSSRYPFRVPRVYIKDYFGVPPSDSSLLESVPDVVRGMKPENADKYMFRDECGNECIGAEAFCDMLVQSGALMQYISKEWVRNHYKWIVWKLACYERRYPAKHAGKFLRVSCVLEELKYRYEREINHGHRPAIKRIMEGDIPPSTMVVLCISEIHSYYEQIIKTSMIANGVESSGGGGAGAKVELTDGWYTIDALLDDLLSKQLAAGKLFVGQKLRIWGAKLCGWAGPISPLEAPKTVSLVLNINGTYRAHWAERLGVCMAAGDPLAFRCIKSDGGPIPRTLVGVTRIYPILYKERLPDGGSVVRSDKMESKIAQLHDHRRSVVAEGIISEYQSSTHNYSEGEEGAKILKLLESAAEPEVIMAGMSTEQLNCFAAYKSKQEASRQVEMEKSIEKALTDAGLREREVTPFLRVRVVGLTSITYQEKGRHKEGIITIWNPTEKQQSELVEGRAYAVEGLVPLHSESEIIYLHTRGSTSKWKSLSHLSVEHFKPFFSPRKSILLSNLGELPLSSEFDIAALVVYVGEVYKAAHQKKQWVFVTDDSLCNSPSEDLSNSLLAISFSSPCIDDSFQPFNSNLVGSIVGFCNVIKKAKDHMNHLWVAESTENSTYILNFTSPDYSHLKTAAASVQTWAKISPSIIEKLKEKVQFILSNSNC